MAEVAKLLGYTSKMAHRRALRYLRRLEGSLGVKLLTVTGTGRQTRYTTTIPVLREHVPELFYRRDETQEALREYIEDFDEKLESTNRRLVKKIEALEVRVDRLELRLGVTGGSQQTRVR
jgi:molybdenum-dependent DNA-binding transcriptional regulator ModE